MLNNIEHWSGLSDTGRTRVLERPAAAADANLRDRVRDIVATVRARGDAALFDYARTYDRCELTSLRVGDDEFADAERSVSAAARSAIELAIANVYRFHEAQIPTDIDIEVSAGVRCQRINQPIDAVGLYVPAGSAPLPSTAVMLAVPAAIAACPVRIMCTPAGRDGKVDAATLVAARLSGIQTVFKTGGAQAIAAMAWGTGTVPKVDKIFGPGNTWVTAAKILVAGEPGGPSMDMPAGPSEVLVIADDSANPVFVAADLLSQAEHGPDSQVILVTPSPTLANDVVAETRRQLERLGRRQIAEASLQSGRVIVTADIATAVDISNRYAPEHLLLQVDNARAVLAGVRNAGSVFLGHYAPEAVGDYCSGTNHVLPTYGAARSYSGLGVGAFMRQMTVQDLTADGLRALAPTVVELAALEGLDAHAAAARARLDELGTRRAAQ